MSENKYDKLISLCISTAADAKHCATACLSGSNVQLMVRCIRLDHDCTNICLLAMESLISDSDFVTAVCRLCGEICVACAEECERYPHMEHCMRCAESCRQCAVECFSVAGFDKRGL